MADKPKHRRQGKSFSKKGRDTENESKRDIAEETTNLIMTSVGQAYQAPPWRGEPTQPKTCIFPCPVPEHHCTGQS